MAIREVPAVYDYICDKCGRSKRLPYREARPAGWASLFLERGQDSVTRLFCGPCGVGLKNIVDDYEMDADQ